MDPSVKLDKYVDDDIFSSILKWGLYFGAFFQLACIITSILMPYTSHRDKEDSQEDSKASCEPQPINRRLHKIRKQEKKKRR
ncbi:protein anon-73B1 [Musca autumnalis]|uniref:protein anon-73B1 n=1 Tax=Musca autumnalis TaxID=221902 RepID=UPI003CE7B6FF